MFWEKGGSAHSATFCVANYPENFVLENSDTGITREAENPRRARISEILIRSLMIR